MEKLSRAKFAPNKCRLCGLHKSSGSNVFSPESKQAGILTKINKLLSREIVHITPRDCLPKFICSACEIVVSNFSEFCDTVQKAQHKLETERLNLTPLPNNNITLDVNTPSVSVGPDIKVECLICRAYLDVEHTTLHMVTHGIGTVIGTCRICGHQAELASFITNLIGENISSVWCRSCCFISTSDKQQDIDIKYSCDVCSKVFRSQGHLSRHQVIHNGSKPFLCEVCGSGFSQRSSLKLHVLTHTGRNPFKCKQCGQTFRFKVSLRSHVLSVHGTNESNHGCDLCDKQFATSYKLRRHYRRHTGERPYECPLCKRLFSQTGNLNLHMKKHKQQEVQESFSLQLLTSKTCNNPIPYIAQPHPLNESIIQEHHNGNDMAELSSSFVTGAADLPASNYLDPIPADMNIAPIELFSHFGQDSLLFIDEAPSSSEGVTLPTFSSLQSGTTHSSSSLPHIH